MRARIALVAALAAALPLAALLLTALAAPPSGVQGDLTASARDEGPTGLALPGAVALPPGVLPPAAPAVAGARGTLGPAGAAHGAPREAPAPGSAGPADEAHSSGRGLLRVAIANNGTVPVVVAVRLSDGEGLPQGAEVVEVRPHSRWTRDHVLDLGTYRVVMESLGIQASVTADLAACPTHVVRAEADFRTDLRADGVTLASAAYPAVCVGPAEARSRQV